MKSIVHLALLLPGLLFGQSVKIGDTATPPDPSAGLDVDFSDRGFLPPRLTLVQRNAISAPADGLIIFNTDQQCVQVYFSTGWQNVTCRCQTLPDAGFSVPSQISISSAATFTASSSGLTYSWNFQGGTPTTSTQASPSVHWSQAGTYTVSLHVSDANGCSDSSSQSVTVVNCPSASHTFSFTGAVQTLTIPACITQVTVDVQGAQGGATSSASGGRGARVQGQLTVTPGSTLSIYVGGQNGYNGGGSSSSGGVGGGASDIRVGGTALSNRIVVAGGGGGAGAKGTDNVTTNEGGAGGGGGLYGLPGLRGNNSSSTQYVAANAGSVNSGGSGGLGYYVGAGGGGGGGDGGGGGGENCSYCGNTAKTGGSAGGCGQGSSSYGSNGGCIGVGGSSSGAGGGGGSGYYGGGSGCRGNGSGHAGGGGGGGGSSLSSNLSGASISDDFRTGNGTITISW